VKKLFVNVSGNILSTQMVYKLMNKKKQLLFMKISNDVLGLVKLTYRSGN